METRPVWKDGRVLTATQRSADKAAAPNTDHASNQVAASVCMAGRVHTVINASLTRAVYMEPALNPGSVSVTPTGADNSVTKI